MQLLTQLCPDAKKVAMLYCTSEANSKFQIDLAKEEAAKYGIGSNRKKLFLMQMMYNLLYNLW